MTEVFVYGGDDYPYTGSLPFNVFRGNAVVGTAKLEGGQLVIYDLSGTPVETAPSRDSLNQFAEISLP